jgi:hypothetical protein
MPAGVAGLESMKLCMRLFLTVLRRPAPKELVDDERTGVAIAAPEALAAAAAMLDETGSAGGGGSDEEREAPLWSRGNDGASLEDNTGAAVEDRAAA